MNALQSQKRVRIGAVTRSLISSSSNANGSINIVETRHPEGTNPPKLVQNFENLTTPQIRPAAPQEPDHFFKVCPSEIYRRIYSQKTNKMRTI